MATVYGSAARIVRDLPPPRRPVYPTVTELESAPVEDEAARWCIQGAHLRPLSAFQSVGTRRRARICDECKRSVANAGAAPQR